MVKIGHFSFLGLPDPKKLEPVWGSLRFGGLTPHIYGVRPSNLGIWSRFGGLPHIYGGIPPNLEVRTRFWRPDPIFMGSDLQIWVLVSDLEA